MTGSEFLDALHSTKWGLLPLKQVEVAVGDTAVLLREVSRDSGSVEALSLSTHAILGIPIKTDARIPEGVWVMRPAGSGLSDPDIQIGAIAPEYVGAAKAFKFLLKLAREGHGRAF